MKAFFLVAALLLGTSSANPQASKRTLTCSKFPRQLSGRLYLTEEQGTHDVRFNLDIDKQFFQAEFTEHGEKFSMYLDQKNNKYYLVHPGGCIAGDPSTAPAMFPLNPGEVSQYLTPVASGKLGLNGASVNLYSVKTDEGSGMVTLEGGDACIPVTFAYHDDSSSDYASYFDLQPEVDPQKMKIPEGCINGRRSFPARLVRISEAVKRGFTGGTVNKRGFPWTNGGANDGVHKRGFPWVTG